MSMSHMMIEEALEFNTQPVNLIEKIAYVTPPYRGLSVRATYLNDDSNTARIEIMRGHEVLRTGTAWAYKIWNYSAHANDIIDEFLYESVSA